MVRISDIFKKPTAGQAPGSSEAKPKQEPLPEEAAQQEAKPEIPLSPPDIQLPKAMARKEQAETEEYSSVRIAKVIKGIASDKARSQNLYLTGTQLIKEVLTNAEDLKPIDLVQAKHWIGDMVDCLMSEDTELLHLFYESASENYLYGHMVNTAIMSVEVGLGLGYSKSQLNELGLAGFLHDIGMIKVGNLGMQTRKLSEEEYSQIKHHPLYGAEVLSKIKDISEPIIYAAKEEHERMNGIGYPKGLKGGQISEYARVVGIVDVYEALTHNRPYRKKNSHHEAIKELIANSSLFDPAILKILINKVGVYPISSWVELNSNEIGTVMINNNEFPLRPVVHVLFDATGNRLRDQRVVNLAKQLNLFIKKPLTDDELARQTKELIGS